MNGGHTDNYYFQMVGQNRLRKGARPVPVASAPQTINLASGFSRWTSVSPAYYDPVNDVIWRNFPSSVAQVGSYTNNTGRNDLTVMKVARDATNIYFMAQCNSNITSHTGSNWMVFFIDADTNHLTGWEGYDYAVNLGRVTASTTTLSQNTSTNSSWNWTVVSSAIAYEVNDNQLMLTIPRVALGLTNDPVTFDFHWADSFQTNDIADFGVDGDSAPDGRFNYRYQTQPSQMNSLLQDGFENGEQAIWGNSWAGGSLWGLTASLPYDGDYCAVANTSNGTANTTLSSSINAANYSSMRITFQYKLQQVTQASKVVVTYSGANGSVTITNLGEDLYYPTGQVWGYNERTNVWLHYTDVRYNTGSNAQFFTTNFTFSIAAPFTSSSQYIWIDDVEITGVTTNVIPPALSIAMTNAGSVQLSWPASYGYALQQNSNLASSAAWTTNGYSIITNANGTNSITITPPAGSLFFRLANP